VRSYKAARRAATKDAVPFRYDYEVEVDVLDDNDEPTGQKQWEERSREFSCKGEVSSLLLSELADNASVDVASPEGMSLVAQFFKQAFGDDEQYREFFRLHTKYGTDDLLMDIMGGLVEDFVGRPTTRPSDSPATPSASGEVSKVVSLSRGTVQVVELDPEEWDETNPKASSG
jgi:hypothetical protein